MEGYNKQSIANTNANNAVHQSLGIHLSKQGAFLGQVFFYVIFAICIFLVIFGALRVSKGSHDTDSDSRVEGFKFIRLGFTLFIMYVLCISCLETALQRGFVNAIIEFLIIGAILYVLFGMPKQMLSGFSKGMFYDWFNDDKTEQSMLQTFDSFRTTPIIVLAGVIIAIIIITVLLKL